MAEHAKKTKSNEIVKLDVEANVQTMAGRVFLRQLNEVSHVLRLKDTEVEFKGELLVKSGYVGDCKSAVLYKCPKGYFLFCDQAFGSNNWSVIGSTLEDLLDKVQDTGIKEKLKQASEAHQASA
ncbi:MAG: hypothetical protein ACE5HO_16965 [bacterium]